jgi:hypothetical protein
VIGCEKLLMTSVAVIPANAGIQFMGQTPLKNGTLNMQAWPLNCRLMAAKVKKPIRERARA